MKIRIATQDDADTVRFVHLSAFPEIERDLVSWLAVALLFEKASPPILSLVAEVDGIVVGHVAFSPVTTRDTKEHIGYILAPLAVRPDCQKRGIASQLIKDGIERLSESGSGVLLVYGDPKFYSKFGFSADLAQKYTPPYQLQHMFGWQGMALRDFNASSPAVGISCVSSLDNPALW
jgi:putative acetyltransferase